MSTILKFWAGRPQYFRRLVACWLLDRRNNHKIVMSYICPAISHKYSLYIHRQTDKILLAHEKLGVSACNISILPVKIVNTSQ